MSNKNKLNDDALLDDIVIAAATSTLTGNPGATDAVGMNPLMELALAELADRRARKDQEKEELRRFHAARAEAFKLEQASKIARQSACNHIKERGYGSRIGGQRLSNGHFAYLCQLCFKEFSEADLPPHLAIPMELVGG